MLGCRIRQLFSWLLLIGSLMLGIAFGLGIFNSPTAQAAIQQLEEAPGQMVYQTRHTVKDQFGDRWQWIAFKRQLSNGQSTLELRMVALPGVDEIDRTQPLVFSDPFGQILTASFSEEAPLASNVGQYELRSLLADLSPEIPWKLTVKTLKTPEVKFSISPLFIQELHQLDQFG